MPFTLVIQLAMEAAMMGRGPSEEEHRHFLMFLSVICYPASMDVTLSSLARQNENVI